MTPASVNPTFMRMFQLLIDPINNTFVWALECRYDLLDANGAYIMTKNRVVQIPSADQTGAQQIHDAIVATLKQLEGIP